MVLAALERNSRSSRPVQVAHGTGSLVRQRTQVHELESIGWRRWRDRLGHARPAGWLWPGAGMAGTSLWHRRPRRSPLHPTRRYPFPRPWRTTGHESVVTWSRKENSPPRCLNPWSIRNSLRRCPSQRCLRPVGPCRQPGGRRVARHHGLGLAWHGSGFPQRPWLLFHPGHPSYIVLCESAIDALSCHALHPDYRCFPPPVPGLTQRGWQR